MWPIELKNNNFNDNSLVLLFNFKNIKTLFTADISYNIEKKIINYLEQVDILKVAHHGSKNSNSFDFLKIIQPKICVIGVGKNSYDHPHEDTLKRLNLVNSKVYRTDRDGLIKIYLKSDKKVLVFKEK